MQNAADAAAIAGATNATSSYAAEAQAVAAQFGFQNGSGNIVVQAGNPSAVPPNCSTPPGFANSCYTVTVSDKVPLFLSQVVGYKGTGGKGTTTLSATAVAKKGAAYPYCILAMSGGVTTDILSHGGPKANLNGCNIMSDSNATCTGHTLGAAVGDAHGTNNGCGSLDSSVSGTTAVEFAMVLPSFLMLLLGIISASVVVYTAVSLHNAVEGAARCYSVDASQCGSATTTQTYAQNHYLGPSSPTFTASTPSCGHQVNATLNVLLGAGMAQWTIPLSATACFP